MIPTTRWLGRALAAALLLLAAPAAAIETSVSETRHNLSAMGTGTVRAATEDQICIFCHAPHTDDATVPEWNRKTPGRVTYRPYESSTMSAQPGQPDGVSLQCLSCHDGTISVGAVKNRSQPIRVLGGGAFGQLSSDDSANLGTDLRGMHPISIDYAEAASSRGNHRADVTRLRSEPVDGADLLDVRGKVQCTSCHDPHSDPAASGERVPPFWRGGTWSEVCQSCHVAPVSHQGHDDPSKIAKGCGSCHVGHGTPSQPLLAEAEEEACFSCHGNALDEQDAVEDGLLTRRADPALLREVFNRPYRHPVEAYTLEHDPTEDLLSEGAASPRHVECVDCHDIHDPPLPVDTRGVRPSGAPLPSAISAEPEYGVCYECHSTNANLPYGQTDKSDEFDPSNASYHPVEAPLDDADTPSLLFPWRSGDRITCSDCHGGERAEDPAGPHGSKNAWLLKNNYTATDGSSESASAYGACYQCHSRTTIISDVSWGGHGQHVVTEQISCYSCHDSHGSPVNPGLIRFNKDARFGMVAPSDSGRLEYDGDTRRCWSNCHGANHEGAGYAQ